MMIVPHIETKMVYEMKCEVKKKTLCEPQTKEKCEEIEYTETKQIPEEICTEEYIRVPTQEKEHKRKCLMMSNNNTPILTEEPKSETTTAAPETHNKIFSDILGRSLARSAWSSADPKFGPYSITSHNF